MFSPYEYLQYKEDTDIIFSWITDTVEKILENSTKVQRNTSLFILINA